MRIRIDTFLMAMALYAVFLAPTAVIAQRAPSDGQNSFRTIGITTEPGSSIWIDDVFYGKASTVGEFVIRTVSPGVHSIRVRNDGFKEKLLQITALQRGPVQIPLVRSTDPGELAFQEAGRLASQDREKAAEAYRRAIKLRPNYPEAYLQLARVLLDAGNVEEAKSAITSAKRLRPGFAEASAVEGRIHKENGDETLAIAAFRRAILEGHGFQPEAYAGLGILYKEKAEGAVGSGDFAGERANYDEAAKDLKVALKQLSGAPDAIVIYQLLGLIYEKQRRYPEAIATYEEFLRIFPDVPEATAVRSFIVQIRKDMNPQQ
jgi:tetratricopeptide (TPR) repeat protein